jgi:hypothetical protein
MEARMGKAGGLLLDYKKEFKPEWKVPAIRVKFILRDS